MVSRCLSLLNIVNALFIYCCTNTDRSRCVLTKLLSPWNPVLLKLSRWDPCVTPARAGNQLVGNGRTSTKRVSFRTVQSTVRAKLSGSACTCSLGVFRNINGSCVLFVAQGNSNAVRLLKNRGSWLSASHNRNQCCGPKRRTSG